MIPVSEPLLDGRESEYLMRCLESGWISSSGPLIEEFEQKWATECERKFGVSVCNGTAALHAAIAALHLKPGDEVILPTFTIISCASAVVYSGGTPVLVDSDPRTWTMDPEQVATKITPRTRAIMAVHIYGHPVDLSPILELANSCGIAVVEDAAEAHGAEYLLSRASGEPEWKRCGSFGLVSCFSFFANKLVTTGEGGMVLTDDVAIAQTLRSIRNLYFQPGRRFLHDELGFNFRMTSLQAALGLAQIERFDRIVAKKRWMGEEYGKRLAGMQEVQLPVEEPWARSVFWMYGVVVSEATGMTAEEFAQRLQAEGVETRPFFLGMHEQPVFHRRGLFAGEHYPVAERLARQGLYLPSGMAITEEQIDHVVRAVRKILGR